MHLGFLPRNGGNISVGIPLQILDLGQNLENGNPGVFPSTLFYVHRGQPCYVIEESFAMTKISSIVRVY